MRAAPGTHLPLLRRSGHHRERGALIEQVDDDHPAVEITSERGSAVLMSRAEYDALQETAHLLRAAANARRLLDSLQQARPARGARAPVVVRVVFTPHGGDDSLHRQSTDRNILTRLDRLIDDTRGGTTAQQWLRRRPADRP